MTTLPPTAHRGVIASAGSKIMMTGGYLVLTKPNNGLVIGVDAKLYTGVYPLNPQAAANPIPTGTTREIPVTVLTPQRTTTPLHLTITLHKHNITQQQQQQSDIPTSPYDITINGDYAANGFVSKSLHYSLIAISSLITPESFEATLSTGLLLDIRGDRQFYSSLPIPDDVAQVAQNFQLPDDTTITTEPIYHDNPENYTTKTGLGSSAAVVSSLVSGSFAFFGLLQPSPRDLQLIPHLSSAILPPNQTPAEQRQLLKRYAYRIAQIAHCIAQGKVGSGFDVSTAFYGTQVYCRFSPKIIADLITTPLEQQEHVDNKVLNKPTSTVESNQVLLSALYTTAWDDVIKPLNLPKFLEIIVADVQGGSETPGMVKMVNEWLKNAPGAEETWNKLAANNKHVEEVLLQLFEKSKQHPKVWSQTVDLLSAQKINGDIAVPTDAADYALKAEFVVLVKDLYTTFQAIRALLRQIGDEANVPIEPAPQINLLNTTQDNNGVLLAGVPGAGGYDAAFALVFDNGNKANLDAVIECWKTVKFNDTDDNAIQQLKVNVDQNGGVQTRVAYKDFPQL